MKQITSVTVSSLLLAGSILPTAATETVHVAVASNFVRPMQALASMFESNTSHQVILSPGSTGKHYAQIVHGAPFDVFFAADAHRPKLLEADGVAVKGSRFTYAIGQLVLWSPDRDTVDVQDKLLRDTPPPRIAIANPTLAPYGAAAHSTLQKLNLWERLADTVVRGENVAQAFQYAATGNADAGFVALAQVRFLSPDQRGSKWLVPDHFYEPIMQQAVLLDASEAAKAFLDFVQDDEALQLIRNHGYKTP